MIEKIFNLVILTGVCSFQILKYRTGIISLTLEFHFNVRSGSRRLDLMVFQWMKRKGLSAWHNPLLPAAYRRWPLLAGVSAGLWVLVLVYLARMILNLVRGNGTIALFSFLWSLVCFFLWSMLYNWAIKKTVD
jgi:hypothetical protein